MDDETGVTVTETGDTDDRDGCHHDTRTVIEPPVKPSGNPSEREGARARVGEEDLQERKRREVADRRKAVAQEARILDEQLMELVVGRGNNPWPGGSGNEPGFRAAAACQAHAGGAVAGSGKARCLSGRMPEKDRRPEQGQPTAQMLGHYLKDKLFLLVDKVAPAAVRAVDARPANVVVVAPLGPMWGALRAVGLAKGSAAR